MSLLAGRRYGIVGLGRNGLPAARALRQLGADVACWDDGEAARAAAVAEGLAVREIRVRGLDGLVLSPGIAHSGPRAHPLARAAIEAGVRVISDAVLLFEAVRLSGSRARFVGITGTNGKSTTTVLLRHILARAGIEAAAGGNLGPAALALPMLGDRGVYVLEMSSYMLERVPGLAFEVACLLNLSPDHLQRHGDMAGYVAAKRHVFEGCAHAIVGIDDAWSETVAAGLVPAPITVSGTGRAATWACVERSLVREGAVVADLDDCPALPGAHNAQNAAAACAAASWLGVPVQSLASSLASFEGLAHRQKRIAVIDGVAFVDDSKATNADAASRALTCTPDCVWIAGGLAKADGIDGIEGLERVAEAVLIGRDAPFFAATLAARGVRHRIAGTLDEAVPIAFEAARALGAGTVLLSPAAASFDQFADFEARGRHFAVLVERLATARGVAA